MDQNQTKRVSFWEQRVSNRSTTFLNTSARKPATLFSQSHRSKTQELTIEARWDSGQGDAKRIQEDHHPAPSQASDTGRESK